MTNPKHSQPGRSESEPFHSLVASTEQAAKAVAPMMKCAACANLELASLAGRRAKAYLDIPNEIAQCRGPQDIVAAQARFWQAMLRDYADFSQRVVTAMQSFDGEIAAEVGQQATRERDTLIFPGVFGFPAWQIPAPPEVQRPGEHRAA